MLEAESHVHVCVRCRPLQRGESSLRNGRKFMSLQDTRVKLTNDDGKHIREYHFDKVFEESSTQNDVYEYCAKGLVEGCFHGFNATIFAAFRSVLPIVRRCPPISSKANASSAELTASSWAPVIKMCPSASSRITISFGSTSG